MARASIGYGCASASEPGELENIISVMQLQMSGPVCRVSGAIVRERIFGSIEKSNILYSVYSLAGMSLVARVSVTMELINIYKCLCDMRRLRILNLLREGPLCVCHLQELLGESQVQISKRLAYMRKLGIVEASRQGAWMVYRLSAKSHPVLHQNLKCLQDCAMEYPIFREDRKRRGAVIAEIQSDNPGCPAEICL